MSDSLQPHGPQNTRLCWPPLSPGVCSNSCPLSWWCYQTILSSATHLSFCLQSFPASGSFPMSQLFALSWNSSTLATSSLPMNIQAWFPLGLTAALWKDPLNLEGPKCHLETLGESRSCQGSQPCRKPTSTQVWCSLGWLEWTLIYAMEWHPRRGSRALVSKWRLLAMLPTPQPSSFPTSVSSDYRRVKPLVKWTTTQLTGHWASDNVQRGSRKTPLLFRGNTALLSLNLYKVRHSVAITQAHYRKQRQQMKEKEQSWGKKNRRRASLEWKRIPGTIYEHSRW